jgi:6-phosphogluconolactonase
LDNAATAYERVLKRFYGSKEIRGDRPMFDVTLLGIGEDGHTASLFPGEAALGRSEAWVVPVPKHSPERISLTLTALNSSRNVALLATGKHKRAIISRVWAGDTVIPVARIRPAGHLHWFLDRDAVPEISPRPR